MKTLESERTLVYIWALRNERLLGERRTLQDRIILLDKRILGNKGRHGN